MYQDSLRDIEKTIKAQYADIQRLTDAINDLDPNDPQRAILESQRRSKVYQKQYQESLKKQVSEILDKMNTKQYLSVSDYLNDCYTNGFVGAMYDLHGQGIPLMLPIDQQAMVRAVQLDSKISKGLYTKMGIDVGDLKNRITSTVSRAMATGLSFERCAKDLANQTKIGFNKAVRIARTEGHRIQTTATMDAMTAAKDNGADVLKQWDATLDGNTRESHAMVDGEIRELHQKFSNGLDYPGSGGKASEVVNCRCALLQRARWALDDDELKTLQERAKYFGLDKAKNFEDFKKNYLKYSDQSGIMPSDNSQFIPANTRGEAVQYASQWAQSVKYDGITNIDSLNEINQTLDDLTKQYPIEKLDYIASGKLRGANARANGKVLEIDLRYANDPGQPTDWLARVERNKQQIEQYLPFTDKNKYPPSTVKTWKKYIAELEDENKYTRWSTSSSLSGLSRVKATVTHEYGHILADQLFGQINGKYACPGYEGNSSNPFFQKKQLVYSVFQQARTNGDIYGISMYANTNEREFFAECFAMKQMGEVLPDYIEEMLKVVLG